MTSILNWILPKSQQSVQGEAYTHGYLALLQNNIFSLLRENVTTGKCVAKQEKSSTEVTQSWKIEV